MRAYAVMLPRLEAEESMLTAERIAVGVGRLEPRTASQFMQRWMKAKAKATTRSGQRGPTVLPAGIGIGLRVMPGGQAHG